MFTTLALACSLQVAGTSLQSVAPSPVPTSRVTVLTEAQVTVVAGDGVIRIVDLEGGEALVECRAHMGDAPPAVAFVDDEHVLIHDQNGRATLRTTAGLEEVSRFDLAALGADGAARLGLPIRLHLRWSGPGPIAGPRLDRGNRVRRTRVLRLLRARRDARRSIHRRREARRVALRHARVGGLRRRVVRPSLRARRGWGGGLRRDRAGERLIRVIRRPRQRPLSIRSPSSRCPTRRGARGGRSVVSRKRRRRGGAPVVLLLRARRGRPR